MVSKVIEDLIRDVPDFPKPGIVFKDITPILADAKATALIYDALAAPYLDSGETIDLVLGIESRGFIFGTPVAQKLGVGFAPIPKPGKLPRKTVSQSYQLEYGEDTLELHQDAIQPGQRVVIVDDLLATGGTMEAACKLVEVLGGVVAGCSFMIELGFLDGRAKLGERPVHSLIKY